MTRRVQGALLVGALVVLFSVACDNGPRARLASISGPPLESPDPQSWCDSSGIRRTRLHLWSNGAVNLVTQIHAGLPRTTLAPCGARQERAIAAAVVFRGTNTGGDTLRGVLVSAVLDSDLTATGSFVVARAPFGWSGSATATFSDGCRQAAGDLLFELAPEVQP